MELRVKKGLEVDRDEAPGAEKTVQSWIKATESTVYN